MAEPARAGLRCGAVILAAGASSRMGSPKQLLTLEGQTLLVRTVEAALASPVWPVVVVLGAQAEMIGPTLAPYPVLVAENPAWPEGMASSLRVGIGMLQQFSRRLEAAVVLLCDQPALTAGTIELLLQAQVDSGRTMVAARYAGRLGAPALFLREHFGSLAALTGETGARDLLKAQPGRVTAVDLPELAVDLDTPQDLAAQRNRQSG
jgi:molybdenum cofactor cytidylyltransferase